MASLRLPLPRQLRLAAPRSRIAARKTPASSWVCNSCVSSSASSSRIPRVRTFSAFAALQNATSAKIGSVDPSLEPLQRPESFIPRHIGPDVTDAEAMLKALDPPAKSIDEFIAQVVPPDVISERKTFGAWDNEGPLDESKVLARATAWAKANEAAPKPLIGAGYNPSVTPRVIQTNVLESPAWYTSYTPYQPEISQGRLESLLNYQTMVSDLTGLPISNASLLDEGTAAAEAMTLSMNALSSSRAKRPGKTFVVSHLVHPQSISVIQSRAQGFGIKVEVIDVNAADSAEKIKALGQDLVGVMVQYPDTQGKVEDFKGLSELVHEQGALLSAATDLLALTVLTPPGEWGADIAFGSAQRFGVPLGFGGPHAAFFAVKEAHKRRMPGRLVGVSKDRNGNRALRLALQTREQHIRREKATSNVCTAQALLANMAALFAVYHGPEGLKEIASRLVRLARGVQAVAEASGLETEQSGASPDGKVLFDTVVIKASDRSQKILAEAKKAGLGFRDFGNGDIGISVNEHVTEEVFKSIAAVLGSATGTQTAEVASKAYGALTQDITELLPATLRRQSAYLTHPVFNTHRSETEILRYIHYLQSKDLSLVHSMIPLGSCTMKLNGATEMALITLPGFSTIHPHTPASELPGYTALIESLSDQLKGITSMDAVSLQPNSGAQGEFAGLQAIRKHLLSKPGGQKRDICLIPVSAHGTNPASAAMAGMRVVPIKCDQKTGNLDIEDLEAKCKKHAEELGAFMVTYPSTYGVYEPAVKKACELVHKYGGQVYMDGANMNAQIGIASPGEIGADVCHLNLHKTFCIPHGGGGPGVGPICVKEHLAPFLPGLAHDADQAMVSSAPFGSAGILPISWAYNALMGNDGLRLATKTAILNANYILARLKPHYKILYTNENGRCAHEFILDARPFIATAGVEAIDIAKRLQDYGFHAPTMSFPVANTLMIEPTESESKEELDRFVDALISIREEIREIEEGKQPREGNVLRMAPHPQMDVILGDGEGKWDRPYSREKAAYPLPHLKEKKFWPSVARVDDTYGDTHLFCTCPPVEDTTSE
ncbi:glycine dehydrogenase [Colletotrichum scovillei]|uniref:Glycine cleavage system P protein n=1 Tax=Colletotrichum scovillei TaxID=1209932 RepID=A0A9P7R054_9PEZI|nr:glycine dehydrogenase [Colletotrichum scovillei]KAF4779059.1 glycine dehydrogenase [Colletotrichum scovillei]KAG7047061.1 glycine dehydrogenase [Colletotrichum scovillei]KAG7056936.1 glycine dehydrogenase [Colletotrichum scovillei]KAG7066828.1 glycine dehydrogenase [Colletotrichum scovillei]